MTQPGSVVEILVQTRGSQLVGDHTLGATTLLVDDPTPFDDAGGQVLVDGNAYTFTSVVEVADTVDPAAANAQLVITPGLVAAVSDLSPVEMWSGDQVLDDLVLIVATGEEADPPVPVTTTSDQRAFWEARLGPVEPPVAVVLSDDLTQLLDAPGWTPSINGAALVGFPDPVEIAVDPPAVSPAITTVQGNATGLTIVTDAILPTTLVDFLINGVVVAANQRTTVINLTTDGTDPLVVDTDYTVTTQAHNAATDADPTLLPAVSAGVTARLDPGMTATDVVAILQAGFILAGSIQVGSSMTLDGQDGITITQPDGRQTFMHADGSGNQFIGQAILDAVTILGALAIQSGATLSNVLTLLSGVTDPTTKPGVTAAGWDSVGSTSTYGFQPHGLFDNTTSWVYTDTLFTAGNVNSINKTTGVRSLLASLPTGFNGVGGVVKVGTSWYVLGRDNNRSADWYVYVFNTSWVKTGEWAPSGAPSDSLTIGIDGAGGLLIAKRTVAGSLFINPYTTAGVSSASLTYPTWSGAVLAGVLKVAVDTATVRYVVASSDTIRVFSSTTGARVTAEEWTPAGTPISGIGNDGSNFFTLRGSGNGSTTDKVWKYTNLIGTYDFAFDWYDNDTAGSSGAGTGLGGANTARTRASVLRTIAPTKRAKWTISLPSAPPDDLTTDGANTANFYAAPTGNTLVLQTTLPTSPAVGGTPTSLSATYSTLATSGTAPSSTNGFAARPGAVGRIASTAVMPVSGNPKFDFRGDGTALINDIAMTDTGWVNMASFGSGWAAGSPAPQSRVLFGVVHYRGLLTRSTGSGTTMATTAAGHGPSAAYSAYTRTSSASLPFSISTGGVLAISGAYTTGDNVSLDGHSYPLG